LTILRDCEVGFDGIQAEDVMGRVVAVELREDSPVECIVLGNQSIVFLSIEFSQQRLAPHIRQNAKRQKNVPEWKIKHYRSQQGVVLPS
jgi:hypothetical protein